MTPVCEKKKKDMELHVYEISAPNLPLDSGTIRFPVTFKASHIAGHQPCSFRDHLR